MGLDLHAESPGLGALTSNAVPSSIKQAVPLTPRVWRFLLLMAQSSNVFVSALAGTWLLIMHGVLRFIHVQRSTIQVYDVAITGLAALGKSKMNGTRAPFAWICPRTVHNTDIAKCFTFLSTLPAVTEGFPFLLPEFMPKRCTLGSVSTTATIPMKLARFQRLSSQLFLQEPLQLSPTEVHDITSYSARRCIPSLADLMGFSPGDRLKIGGWNSEEVRLAKRQATMPDHYSHQAAHSAAS